MSSVELFSVKIDVTVGVKRRGHGKAPWGEVEWKKKSAVIDTRLFYTKQLVYKLFSQPIA